MMLVTAQALSRSFFSSWGPTVGAKLLMPKITLGKFEVTYEAYPTKEQTNPTKTCDKINKIKTKDLMTQEKPQDRGKNLRSTVQGRRSTIITNKG